MNEDFVKMFEDSIKECADDIASEWSAADRFKDIEERMRRIARAKVELSAYVKSQFERQKRSFGGAIGNDMEKKMRIHIPQLRCDYPRAKLNNSNMWFTKFATFLASPRPWLMFYSRQIARVFSKLVDCLIVYITAQMKEFEKRNEGE